MNTGRLPQQDGPSIPVSDVSEEGARTPAVYAVMGEHVPKEALLILQ